MEILCSFLRRHFEGKQVVASKCKQFSQASLNFSVSITFHFPAKQDNFTNASLDYSLLYLSDFCHDLHKKLKDWMILLVRVNWNAWLDGDKTFDIVEQPLNPTSNNSRVRMVKSCTIPCLWPQQIRLQIHYGSLWES